MTTTETRPTRPAPGRIDARGPRFGAVLTTVVLAVTLVAIPSTLSVVLLTMQTVVFALGSLVGLHAQPYGIVFRRVVRPRLGAPTTFEDQAPPRFAQTVGLAFALVGLIALISGATVLAYAAVALALAAAFLNAAFDFCLGCEMYLLGRRAFAGRVPTLSP